MGEGYTNFRGKKTRSKLVDLSQIFSLWQIFSYLFNLITITQVSVASPYELSDIYRNGGSSLGCFQQWDERRYNTTKALEESLVEIGKA